MYYDGSKHGEPRNRSVEGQDRQANLAGVWQSECVDCEMRRQFGLKRLQRVTLAELMTTTGVNQRQHGRC